VRWPLAGKTAGKMPPLRSLVSNNRQASGKLVRRAAKGVHAALN
jgi:hypothetical protein